METNRRYLIAKRTCVKNDVEVSERHLKMQRNDKLATASSKPTKIFKSSGTKNIANERMKRLRAALSSEMVNSQQCNISEPSTKKSSSSNSYENTSNKSSMNERLKIFKEKTPTAICSTTFSVTSPPISRVMQNQMNTSAVASQCITVGSEYCNMISSVSDDLDDSMDWSPISEELIISNINEARDMLYGQQFDALNMNRVQPSSTNYELDIRNVYVIVDTNIFIDKLQTIINIMSIIYSDNTYPVVYVPWMVIQELDYFKDGYSISASHPISKQIQIRSRKAVHFINDCLKSGKPNFLGQSVQKAAQCNIRGSNGDDSILNCCIQKQTEGCEVVLLSCDINLRNKAMISRIGALPASEIIGQLKRFKPTRLRQNIVEKLSKDLGNICSFILQCELNVPHGNKALRFDEPWSFPECIKYFKMHYDRLFYNTLQKQCRKVIDDIHELLFNTDVIINDKRYQDLCISLLIYLQTGLPRYGPNIQAVIDQINHFNDK